MAMLTVDAAGSRAQLCKPQLTEIAGQIPGAGNVPRRQSVRTGGKRGNRDQRVAATGKKGSENCPLLAPVQQEVPNKGHV